MTVMAMFDPQQESTAVGGVKFQGLPAGTVKFDEHVMTGGVVSTIVTVWLHKTEFEQQSLTRQTRVWNWLQNGPESGPVLKTVMVRLVPQQASMAVGASNDQFEPH